MITVTDTITGASATIEKFDLAETIGPWFPDAPAEVADQIARLQAAVMAGTHTWGIEDYLGVKVETH